MPLALPRASASQPLLPVMRDVATEVAAGGVPEERTDVQATEDPVLPCYTVLINLEARTVDLLSHVEHAKHPWTW